MKVKTLITLKNNGAYVKPGSVIDMDDAEAKVNIQRKFVESAEVVDATAPVTTPATAETETDEATRQIGQVVEPESLVGEVIDIPELGSVVVESAEEDGTLIAESIVEPPVKPAVQAPKPAQTKNKGKGR